MPTHCASQQMTEKLSELCFHNGVWQSVRYRDSSKEETIQEFVSCTLSESPHHQRPTPNWVYCFPWPKIHSQGFIIWTPTTANSESGFHEKRIDFFSPKKTMLIIKSSNEYLIPEFPLWIHCKKTKNSSRWNLKNKQSTKNIHSPLAFTFSFLLFSFSGSSLNFSFSLGTHKMVRMLVQYGRSKKPVCNAFYFLIWNVCSV